MLLNLVPNNCCCPVLPCLAPNCTTTPPSIATGMLECPTFQSCCVCCPGTANVAVCLLSWYSKCCSAADNTTTSTNKAAMTCSAALYCFKKIANSTKNTQLFQSFHNFLWFDQCHTQVYMYNDVGGQCFDMDWVIVALHMCQTPIY